MSDATRAFYDDLADYQHLVFQDWNRSIAWQAGLFGPLLERDLAPRPLHILDCACGIGTQALGLAARGHIVTGLDLSPAAIARAHREALARGLAIQFETADMRDLSTLPAAGFDAALAADNALPHLLDAHDLSLALAQIAARLRPGGLFLATIRDYDAVLAARPPAPPPSFFQDGPYRRIHHQVWDWTSDRQYTVHLYLTRETAAGWESRHFMGVYRAWLRDELAALARQAGFAEAVWRMPVESGFYQPMLLARTAELPSFG